jgi:hypothetical protein
VALKDGKVFSSENNHIVCFVSLIVNAKRNVSIDGSRTIDCLYDNFDQISRNNFGLVKKKRGMVMTILPKETREKFIRKN